MVNTKINDGRWSLTPRGFLVSNVIIGEVLESQTQQHAILARKLRPEQEDMQIGMTMFDKKQEEIPLFQGIWSSNHSYKIVMML